MVNLNNSHHLLRLDNELFHAVDFNEVKPGDIVGTYESVTTNPTNIRAIFAQRLTPSGSKAHLAKMVHYEIVTELTKNPSIVRVAHASGITGRVLEEEQDLSSFSFGTGLVIFRPKSTDLAEKICEIARNTANTGNIKWGIKTLQNPISMIKSFIPKQMEKHLRTLARLTVDSHSYFKKKDGSEKTMSCVQYCNAVLNTSILSMQPSIQRILESGENRNTKIELILLELENGGLERLMGNTPLFHRNVHSSSFTDKLLTEDTVFEKVGYAGSIADGLTRTPVQVKLGEHQIDIEWLATLGIGSSEKIKRVFTYLGLFDGEDSRLVGYLFEKKANLKAAFFYLYALENNLNIPTVLEFIRDSGLKQKLKTTIENWPVFKGKYGEGVDEVKLQAIYFKDRGLSPLVYEAFAANLIEQYLFMEEFTNASIETILDLENGALIPRSNPSPVLFSDHLFQPSAADLNIIRKVIIDISQPNMDKNAYEYMRTNQALKNMSSQDVQALQIYMVALVAFAGIFYAYFGEASFVPTALAATTLVAKAAYGISKYRAWSNKNTNIYRREMENLSLTVMNFDAGLGKRPWITYTVDGKNWYYKCARQIGKTGKDWEVLLTAASLIEYKFFIGPWDASSANPTEGARWQRGDNIRIEADKIDEPVINQEGRLVIDRPLILQ